MLNHVTDVEESGVGSDPGVRGERLRGVRRVGRGDGRERKSLASTLGRTGRDVRKGRVGERHEVRGERHHLGSILDVEVVERRLGELKHI